MSALFGSSPKTPAPPPVPKSTDLAEDNAASAQRLRMRFAKGRQASMLTSGLDLGTAPTGRKTLGGF